MESLLIVILLLVFAGKAYSQSVLENRVNITLQNQTLDLFLNDYEKTHSVKFFFRDEWINQLQVGQDKNGQTLRELLMDLLGKTDISFAVLQNYSVIFIKDPAKIIEREQLLQDAYAKKRIVKKLTFGDPVKLRPGLQTTLRGRIVDLKNEDPILGATVVLDNGSSAG